jgi:hypothetical protein
MSLNILDLQSISLESQYKLPTREEIQTAVNNKDLNELRRIGKLIKVAIVSLKTNIKK